MVASEHFVSLLEYARRTADKLIMFSFVIFRDYFDLQIARGSPIIRRTPSKKCEPSTNSDSLLISRASRTRVIRVFASRADREVRSRSRNSCSAREPSL